MQGPAREALFEQQDERRSLLQKMTSDQLTVPDLVYRLRLIPVQLPTGVDSVLL